MMTTAARRKRAGQSAAMAAPSPAAARARIEEAFGRRGPGLWWCLPPIVAIWLIAAGYFFLVPPTYHSKWSLILPAASNGSTVSLDSIGQTSTSPSHPFSSVTLSPKVIYKEIATSEQVREAAARALGIEVKALGKPRVTLIDETSLMMFRMTGRSPQEAQQKARAVMQAFEQQLDVLRRDEQDRRARLVKENLKIYRANLDRIRAKMKKFQEKTGLLSLDQFKETAISAELLRRKLAMVRSDEQRLIHQQAKLVAEIGLPSELAAAGVRIASDPSFEQLAASYATESAKLHKAKLSLGPNHPRLGILKRKVAGVMGEIREVVSGAGITQTAVMPKLMPKLMLVLNSSNQSDLLKAIVDNQSALAGRREEVLALEGELAKTEAKVTRLGKAASQLEALKKDHLVAEAVFTSAVARLDISRTDLFASYPMVQMLASPSLPEKRSQPRLIYALAAGLLGTFLIMMAWVALWVRNRLSRAH